MPIAPSACVPASATVDCIYRSLSYARSIARLQRVPPKNFTGTFLCQFVSLMSIRCASLNSLPFLFCFELPACIAVQFGTTSFSIV